MNNKVYYLAGPMTGRPQFNYPLFDRVATHLREQGYDIQSPAEMDSPEIRQAAINSPNGSAEEYLANIAHLKKQETWADFLARDVKLIADKVHGIILLPDWETSKGARLEVFVALGCGHEVFEFHEGLKAGEHFELIPCAPGYIMKQITREVVKARRAA